MKPAPMFKKLQSWLVRREDGAQLKNSLDRLRKRAATPVFWLFGKTQSGKTSLIKFLTGASDAEIGAGFQPCTRYSRKYQFPNAETPLVTFLDTRGLDEPGYDPGEDLKAFESSAHALIVTVKVLDQATERLRQNWQKIRAANPERPCLLALTCLHEAYPQQQHPQPYPFLPDQAQVPQIPDDLSRALQAQQERFRKLYDVCVPIDLTRQEEGFNDPAYGGEYLHKVMLDMLPRAYRITFLALDLAKDEIHDLHLQQALPYITGYTVLAATAGAVPVPLIDLLILPGIQTRMIYHLARLYRQPLSAKRFLELASTLGMGIALRQASREVLKLIPYVGSVASAAVAAASTFALGRAFCYYYSKICQGVAPSPEELKQIYSEQLAMAQTWWKGSK